MTKCINCKNYGVCLIQEQLEQHLPEQITDFKCKEFKNTNKITTEREIRTKFNVGDKVYYVEYTNKYRVYSSKIILITIEVKDETKLYYYLKDLYKTILENGFPKKKYYYYWEHELFKTKKEAQAECERRNKEK